jgi:N-acylneuraminate cytidylyltransferase
MVKKPEVLAIIPARSGSKGIPGKNIKDFAGFPLLAYSVAAGLESKLVTRVVVSTDSQEIADIAKTWGAEIPFLRPAEFAQDDTLDLPVMLHCLDWLEKNEGYKPDVVVWLRPTSPIRPRNCVDDAVRILLDHPDADSVRGVVLAGQNPFKMWFIDVDTGQMKPLLGIEEIDESYNAPRQILPDVYWQTGHIDAIRLKTITEKGSVTGDTILPLLIDPEYTVDIDLPQDWQTAEQTLYNRNLDMVDPAHQRRGFPDKIDCLILDFDGVLTDDRVWVNERGEEMVAANRADGLGLEALRNHTGIPVIVVSRETNPVVAHRCKKLQLPVLQAVLDKDQAVRNLIESEKFDPAHVVFVGNDINDLVVFPLVGYTIVPADAHPEVQRRADLILSKAGGKGAVREVCDMILSRLENGEK